METYWFQRYPVLFSYTSSYGNCTETRIVNFGALILLFYKRPFSIISSHDTSLTILYTTLMISTDKLFKVREEVINMIIDRCRTVYIPSEHISIHEELLLWKGRLAFKKYIPQNERDVKIFSTWLIRFTQIIGTQVKTY